MRILHLEYSWNAEHDTITPIQQTLKTKQVHLHKYTQFIFIVALQLQV